MNREIEDSFIFTPTNGETIIKVLEESFFPRQRKEEINLGGLIYRITDEGLTLRIISVSRSFPISIIITTPLIETTLECGK